MPLELFFDETIFGEVEEVDVVRARAQIVNTVLVLVSVARTHGHD